VSHSTTFWIPTSDKLRLLGRRWSVAGGGPRAAALLIHGVGEHSGRYDEVAAVMNAAGVEVLSYDQRGFGQSEGKKGCLPTPSALVDDAAMVFAMLENEHPGAAPFLMAHSMGGAVAAFAVTSGAIGPRGLILSSPAIKPRVDDVQEAVLRFLLPAFPDLRLDSHIRPEQVTHDVDVQQAIRDDKLMHTNVSPRLVVSIIDQGAAALAKAASVQIPALFLVAGDDQLVHPEASRAFAAAMPGGCAALHEFPGLFHEIFNERPDDRRKVFTILKAWLDDQI
jgi:alpha-beta hydrolase superfamily lysophospholipase